MVVKVLMNHFGIYGGLINRNQELFAHFAAGGRPWTSYFLLSPTFGRQGFDANVKVYIRQWQMNVLCAVYWLAVLCIICAVFFCCGLWCPAEHLVLTPIRQEASELQDQGRGRGLTMRACLTDTFDKREFASIRVDVAAPLFFFFMPEDACGHAGWDQVIPDPRPF